MKYPTYPRYKDSGVVWLGKVPEHWEVKPIKRVASCNDDLLDESTPDDYEISYVDISSVDASAGIVSTERYKFKSAPSRARRKVKDGDVIVSTVRTYLKAIASIRSPNENLVVSTGFAVIRAQQGLQSTFAGYLLKAKYIIDEVIARSNGVSYPAVNANELIRIKIPLPPVDEQRTIVNFLDRETAKMDTLIAKQERLIELLREKRQSIISHAVTKGLNRDAPMKDSGIESLGKIPAHYNLKPLKYLTYSIGDGIHATPAYDDDSDIYFINGNNLCGGSILVSDTTRTVDEKDYKDLRIDFKQDTILVSINGTIGNLAFYNAERIILGKSAAYIECREALDKTFLFYLLQSSYVFNSFENSLAGTTIKNLSLFSLSHLKVIRPPLREQQEIAAHLHRETLIIDALIEKTRGATELLNEHRTALISSAVTGKIDVRHYVD